MARRIIAATASAALCLMSVASASAQDYRASGFDAPRGATATANFRIPLGGKRALAKPTAGLTLGYGHTAGSPTLDGRTITHSARLADIRFDRNGLNRAEVATFNLADLENDPRLGIDDTDKSKDFYLYGAAIILAILVAVFVLNGDDDKDNSSNNSS